MKNLYYKVGAWMSVFAMSLAPVGVLAQLKPSTEGDLKTIGDKLGTGTPQKLPELIGGLINVFLSVLGIIFVVLVVYAGYLWMTAGGEATKVDKAKKLLGQAVIGLVIIVAAYAITAFVIDKVAGIK